MNKPIIYRQGKMFKIDLEQLPETSRRVSIINSLYYELYKEFAGANSNDKYIKMTNQDKMKCINDFALAWLKKGKYL